MTLLELYIMYYVSFGINFIGLDTPCISIHGTCQDKSQSCNGEYQTNLCGGATSRQCCVPASAGILTSHNEQLFTYASAHDILVLFTTASSQD